MSAAKSSLNRTERLQLAAAALRGVLASTARAVISWLTEEHITTSQVALLWSAPRTERCRTGPRHRRPVLRFRASEGCSARNWTRRARTGTDQVHPASDWQPSSVTSLSDRGPALLNTSSCQRAIIMTATAGTGRPATRAVGSTPADRRKRRQG